MAQRRIRPALLTDNAYGTNYPSPTIRTLNVDTLNGGLNLWELDYRLDINQSPDCLNMYWKDGALSSRSGQKYIFQNTQETDYGDFVDCYEKYWNDNIIVHKNQTLYSVNPTTGAHSVLMSGLTATKGAGFFVFNDKLYYLGGGKYIQIPKTITVSDPVKEVVPYVPTVILGRTPAGTGGSQYQPENRLAPGKRVFFTADGTSTDYYLPYTSLASTTLVVKVLHVTSSPIEWVTYTEVPDVTQASGNVFQVDRTTGVVKFKVAPPQSDPATVNTVDITCFTEGEEQTKAINSIMQCTCSIVYGGVTELAVVLGGTPVQPNAYFWSGNTSTGFDPSYFPADYYNYAGTDSEQYITGFGRQQNLLVIFSERCIGKSAFDSETISERNYLTLPYTSINASIGCDLAGSIQLIQNNLVFANTYAGVYILTDSSAYGENTVYRISRNVNGDGATKGLLLDLRSGEIVCSVDDHQRYWICANEHVYLWDYTIKWYTKGEERLSWFFFDGFDSSKWVSHLESLFYFDPDGNLITENVGKYSDFGNAFIRRYVFATQYFGSYENLKDVLKVVISTGTVTGPAITLSYKTDYEERTDRTVLNAVSWRLVPRDLSQRALRSAPFAKTFVRKPMCWHVRHFQMTMTNDIKDAGMSIMSAQIFYRYAKEDR